MIHICKTPKAKSIIYDSVFRCIDNKQYDLYLGEKIINIKKPRGNTHSHNYKDYTEDEKSKIYAGIQSLRSNILKQGILSFEDAYFLGSRYIKKFPKIVKILQNRFKYVFVDEMQDMDSHQIQILEKLFYKKYIFSHCFKRIGDKNQAIYSGIVKANLEWGNQNYRKELQLTGTHRLTQKVANVVKNFGLEKIDFNGKREIKDDDGKDISLKPILLVYNDNHLNDSESSPVIKDNKILESFSQLIKEQKDNGYFSDVEAKYFKCKAIIWGAKPDDNGFDIKNVELSIIFMIMIQLEQKVKQKFGLKTIKII